MQSTPASLVDSDALLQVVWQVALVLATVSIVIALSLVVRRWFHERARVRKELRKALWSRRIHALLASPREPDARSIPALEPGDEAAIFSVSLNILRVTRGKDAERLLKLLDLWKVRPWLARALRTGRRNRQIRVLTLLARYRDPGSLDLILGRIRSRAVYVQLAALRGLADRGDVSRLPAVVEALSSARETNVPMLTDILRRFGEPAVPSLAELGTSETAVLPVRLATVSALGHIGSLSALGPLLELARDPAPGLRVRALESLARVGDPRAEPAVRAGFEDAEDRVRAAAARAAGLLGLRAALPELTARLRDRFWETRFRAAEALYRLGSPGIAVLRAESLSEGLEGEMARDLLAEMEGVPA